MKAQDAASYVSDPSPSVTSTKRQPPAKAASRLRAALTRKSRQSLGTVAQPAKPRGIPSHAKSAGPNPFRIKTSPAMPPLTNRTQPLMKGR